MNEVKASFTAGRVAEIVHTFDISRHPDGAILVLRTAAIGRVLRQDGRWRL